MNSQDIAWLKSVFEEKGLFANLSPHEIGGLIDHMARVNFARGDTLIQQGDRGEWFFIVQKGKVRATRKKWMFLTEEISVMGPKDFFGELALLADTTRAATLTAMEDTVCFTMYKKQFRDLVESCPAFKQEIERLVAQRLNAAV